ncbi:hypothetical protein Bbelb_014770 [Branchiostoma belcheri]|nr:hypothetical protein Bbelb_014770 [Branchiostoma belcheri]
MSTSGKPNVYVTRKIPQKALDLLQGECNVSQWAADDPVPRVELLKGVKGVDGLYCLLTDKIDAEVLDAAGPGLKVVSTMSVGYDHVSLPELRKRKLPLGYTPDV